VPDELGLDLGIVPWSGGSVFSIRSAIAFGVTCTPVSEGHHADQDLHLVASWRGW